MDPNSRTEKPLSTILFNIGKYDRRKAQCGWPKGNIIPSHLVPSYNKEIMLPMSSAVSESRTTGQPSMSSSS